MESTRGDEVGDIGFWKEADGEDGGRLGKWKNENGDLVSPMEIVE